MDLLELPPMFMLLVVAVIVFVIVRLISGPRVRNHGEQYLCRACPGMKSTIQRSARRALIFVSIFARSTMPMYLALIRPCLSIR